MSKKLSPLWVRSQHGERLHRKREYTKGGGRTLCGIHVGKGWTLALNSTRHKCKRCAA